MTDEPRIIRDFAASELHCEWTRDCHGQIERIDPKGYIYCASHGVGRSRKLRPAELRKLELGEQVESY